MDSFISQQCGHVGNAACFGLPVSYHPDLCSDCWEVEALRRPVMIAVDVLIYSLPEKLAMQKIFYGPYWELFSEA